MKITVSRFNPETDSAPSQQSYDLPDMGKTTVLQALIHIQEHIDSSLAFGYNCRYKNCGLCGMTINGQPQLACLALLRDKTVVEPLAHLPVLRDLMIDRSRLFSDIAAQTAFLDEDSAPTSESQTIHEPIERKMVMACNECLACVGGCPPYRHENGATFAGPMTFVKLTQLMFDPRDKGDRPAQARALGVETCRSCPGCPCPSGIPIRRGAIAALLGEPIIAAALKE